MYRAPSICLWWNFYIIYKDILIIRGSWVGVRRWWFLHWFLNLFSSTASSIRPRQPLLFLFDTHTRWTQPERHKVSEYGKVEMLCIFRQEMWGVYQRVLLLFFHFQDVTADHQMVHASSINDYNPSTWDTQSPSFACWSGVADSFSAAFGIKHHNSAELFVSQFWRLEVWKLKVLCGHAPLKALVRSCSSACRYIKRTVFHITSFSCNIMDFPPICPGSLCECPPFFKGHQLFWIRVWP